MNIIIIGTGNIGFEVVKLLTNGNKILLISRSLPDYLNTFLTDHANVHFVHGDAASEEGMNKIKESEVVKEFGGIDLIICTPGTTSESTPLNDFEGFERCFNTNYYANLIALKVFIPLMSKNNHGKVIILSATSGHHADKRLRGYAASKWALENTYSSLREEVRPQNITVDVIAVRTIKNKYSKIWTQNYGENPENIAHFIYKLIQQPKNKRHFIPRYYWFLRVTERLFPWALNHVHGLHHKRTRKGFYKNTQNNSVLITGAASGLGKALAYTYSNTAKILYLCDIDQEGLVELRNEISKDNKCVVNIAKVNILNRQDVINYTNSIEHVDLLINNAGVRCKGSILETGTEVFQQIFNVNFFGPLLFIAQFFNKEKRPRKIINILSTTAIRGRKNMGVYSSSKAALWNFTRSFRRVYGGTCHIMEVIPSAMSMTRLLENSILTDSKEQSRDNIVNEKSNFQSRLKFLKVSDWSASDAARKIQKYESQGKEIVFLPPIRAKLFLALETTSNWLFSKIFRD